MTDHDTLAGVYMFNGDESPRQFVLRNTGLDHNFLSHDGIDYTWKELAEANAVRLIGRLLMASMKPNLYLKRRENKLNNS